MRMNSKYADNNANRPARCRRRSAGPAGEMLTKRELAARLKVSRRTIETWQHQGRLPYIKIARVVLFYWPDILARLRTQFTVGGDLPVYRTWQATEAPQ